MLTEDDVRKIEIAMEKRFEIYMRHMTNIEVSLQNIFLRQAEICDQLSPFPEYYLKLSLSEFDKEDFSKPTVKTLNALGINTVKDLWFADQKSYNYLAKHRKKALRELTAFLHKMRAGYFTLKIGDILNRRNSSSSSTQEPQSHS